MHHQDLASAFSERWKCERGRGLLASSRLGYHAF